MRRCLASVRSNVGSTLGIGQRQARIVATHDRVALQRSSEVRQQGRQDEGCSRQGVQQCAATGRPAAGGTVILLPINRQVVSVFILCVMISAATLVSYLLPSTMPTGASTEAIPQSGALAQA